MSIFNNTLRVISWSEWLPKFFEEKHQEYELSSNIANGLHSVTGFGFPWVKYLLPVTPKQEEEMNLASARLKFEYIKNKSISKLANMFSYVAGPLTLCLLPVAILADLGAFGINIFTSMFKDQPTADNNTETRNTAKANRANNNRVFAENRSPSMLNAFGNSMGSSRDDNTNKPRNNRHNPRNGLASKP